MSGELNKRQIQKELTRQKILAVAAQEFGRRGIMATRMTDIARAAEVSHGTVFAHFASQEVLITAVIELFGQQVAGRTHELARSSAGVRQVLEAHLAGIAENEAFYTRLVVEGRLLPRAARDSLLMIQAALSLHLNQAAVSEMEEGRIAAMPLPLLFNTWLGLVNYYIANSDWFAPEGSVVQRYGLQWLDHYMFLLRADGTFIEGE